MWFTCDGQMATDTPFLATERLLAYYCYKYGIRGFEFWGLAWWTYNPWEVGWHQFIRQSDEGKKYYWVRYPNGDGFLPIPASRWAWTARPAPSASNKSARVCKITKLSPC